MSINSAMDRFRKAIFGEPVILESEKNDVESPEEVVNSFHENATNAVAKRYSRGSVRLQNGRFTTRREEIKKAR